MDASDTTSTEPDKRLIVIVESDEAIRNSMAFLLEADDYRVRAFGKGEALLLDPPPFSADAFVIGHQLVDMPGARLLKQLRDAGARAPALFVASAPSAMTRRAAAALGAAILQKPLLGNALRQALQGCLACAPDSGAAARLP